MRRIFCEGPNVLRGHFTPQGSKNGALPLLAASIIFDSVIKINNVPYIEDIKTMISILQNLGISCKFVNNSIIVDSRDIKSFEIDWELASKMRASFDLLGSLVFRCSKAVVPFPGGCLIGNRKVDMHLWITKQLGFDVQIESGNVVVNDFDENHVNEEIKFWIPSVGATKNATFLGMFVSNSTNKTVIFHNVAIEPEITYLWDFLIQNGANIYYDEEKRVLKIGPSKLVHSSVITVDNIPDRIEAGTYAIAACATRGNIWIEDNFDKKYSVKNMLSKLWEVLKEIGVDISCLHDGIEVKIVKPLSSFEISTDIYPGFPTDLQPQMVSLALSVDGVSVVRENLFDDRFVYVGELLRLGADINVVGNKVATVYGGKNLKGAPVRATDIRGGAAILIACLMSEGQSVVSDVYQIERGYESIVEKMSKLGARVFEEDQKPLTKSGQEILR